MKILNGLN